jgi:hypothetical protein
VVAERLDEATHVGALRTPAGELPPTGKAYKLPTLSILQFEGKRVSSWRDYFDRVDLLTQLGLMPTRAPESTRKCSSSATRLDGRDHQPTHGRTRIRSEARCSRFRVVGPGVVAGGSREPLSTALPVRSDEQ